jgi:hypothetical protein
MRYLVPQLSIALLTCACAKCACVCSTNNATIWETWYASLIVADDRPGGSADELFQQTLVTFTTIPQCILSVR